MPIEILKPGDTDHQIIKVKQVLMDKGYLYRKASDSHYDELTKEAVMIFQKQFGMVQNGIIDTECVNQLEKINNYIEGIDLSHYQGDVNWHNIAQTHLKFAMIRLNDGAFVDSKFTYNWQESKKHGLIRGIYQFFRPGQDIQKQIDILTSHVPILEEGDLAPILDVEANIHQLNSILYKERINHWISSIEAIYQCKPILYTRAWFWNSQVNHSGIFDQYPLWIANYSVKKPILPKSWKNWTFWQYGMRKFLDIPTRLQANFFQGSLEDLKQMTRH